MTDKLYSFEGTSKTIETKAGNIHYHEAGSGPVLILLHGSGPGVTGWANFNGNLALFAQHFRCIIPDFPGYGNTPGTDDVPIQAGIKAVLALMDELSIDRAHMLGNSFGGIVAALIAAYNPERVDKLSSIGGVGSNLFTASPGEGIKNLVDFNENPTREGLIRWLESMVFDYDLITEELIEERWTNATNPETLAWSRKLYSREGLKAQANPNPKGPHAWEYLPLIQATTLITWGRDDRVSPLDRGIMPMRMIPNCEFHVFPKCGHWAMIERKEEFESVVLAFFLR